MMQQTLFRIEAWESAKRASCKIVEPHCQWDTEAKSAALRRRRRRELQELQGDQDGSSQQRDAAGLRKV